MHLGLQFQQWTIPKMNEATKIHWKSGIPCTLTAIWEYTQSLGVHPTLPLLSVMVPFVSMVFFSTLSVPCCHNPLSSSTLLPLFTPDNTMAYFDSFWYMSKLYSVGTKINSRLAYTLLEWRLPNSHEAAVTTNWRILMNIFCFPLGHALHTIIDKFFI